MEVNCEGCAGCCIDWRALAPDLQDAEHGGTRRPLDDATNLVPLEGEEVRALLEAGYGDAMTPRLWEPAPAEEAAEGTDDDTDDPSRDSIATIDGHDLIAVEGRPVFYVGLRKPKKPVAPVGREVATWLPTCVFLDPETLQCRIHGDDLYPNACEAYPGYNLLLEQETECERVEQYEARQRDEARRRDEARQRREAGEPDEGAGHRERGERPTGDEPDPLPDRLVDDEPPANPPGVRLGPQALGAKLFAHPDPDELSGRVERIARGEPTVEDRAAFVSVAAAASPGTLSVAEERRERAREAVLAADSWVGRAAAEWAERAGGAAASTADESADPSLGATVEGERGAPETPGWE